MLDSVVDEYIIVNPIAESSNNANSAINSAMPRSPRFFAVLFISLLTYWQLMVCPDVAREQLFNFTVDTMVTDGFTPVFASTYFDCAVIVTLISLMLAMSVG